MFLQSIFHEQFYSFHGVTVQLLKSLFCLRGFDNRTRFFAIASAIYSVFIMLASAFSGQYLISTLIALLCSVLLAFTGLRRLHDAKLNKNWLFAPSLSFALTALVIIFSEQHSSYYLLLISVLCSAVLLTYPGKQTTPPPYTLGYLGPVDLSEYQQSTYQDKSAKYRIEPSLAGETLIEVNEQHTSRQQTQAIYTPENSAQYMQQATPQADIGELIRQKILSNKKAQLALLAGIVLVLLAVFTSWLITLFTNSNIDDIAAVEPTQVNVNKPTNTEREHPLAMPDNFTLYLSKHQGVIINWQADAVADSQLWSQFSAQGDESCQEISFNKGQGFRPLTVDVEAENGANSHYYASFSPLDSQALIQALAFRGTFSLCGYNFSLKGSQAALGKNALYAQWVNY